jgi:hypothetical protein
MRRPLIPQRVTLTLLTAVLLLPIALCVVLGTSALLAAMGDVVGGSVLQRVALGCGMLWVIGLICLVVVLAVNGTRDPDEPDGP